MLDLQTDSSSGMKVVRVLLATLVGWTLLQLCASNTPGCLEADPSGETVHKLMLGLCPLLALLHTDC